MTKTSVSKPCRPIPTLAAAVILGMCAAAGVAAAQQPAQAPAATATGEPSRTIHVLTDVPRDQILATMRVISAWYFASAFFKSPVCHCAAS